MVKYRLRIALFLAVCLVFLAFTPASAMATTGTVKVTRVAITAEKGKKELCLDLTPEDFIKLTATVYPANASQDVVWTSAKPEVAVVTMDSEGHGIVTPVGAGYTYIYAQAENSTIKSSVRVDVKPLPTQIRAIVTPLFLPLYKSIKLTASVYPSVAAKDIFWSAVEPSILSVTQTGVIKGMSVGSTRVIMASAYDSDIFIERDVTVVEKDLRSIKFAPTSHLNIPVGFTVPLSVIFSPADADMRNYPLTWKSSNENVLIVTDGLVEAVGAGTAYITCATSDGKKATCRFTVKADPAKIFINGSEDYRDTLAQGKSKTLKITTDPQGAASAVLWSSSNEAFATVDQNGVVKALVRGAQSGPESVVITAVSASGNAMATATFDLVYANVKYIRLAKNQYSMVQYDTRDITDDVTVYPSDADKQTYTAKSSRPEVATIEFVNGRLIITALKHGTATLTVRTDDGGYTATATVSVQKLITPTPSPSSTP